MCRCRLYRQVGTCVNICMSRERERERRVRDGDERIERQENGRGGDRSARGRERKGDRGSERGGDREKEKERNGDRVSERETEME